MMFIDKIDFRKLSKVNPKNAQSVLPKDTGIYFWFNNETDELVYIGVGAGQNGIYNRIVRQHLNPKYIEFRSEKHSFKDEFQLRHPVKKIVKGELKAGIDQSAFRKNIGRTLKIKPGQGTVNYILDNLYLRYMLVDDIEDLKRIEKELIYKYKPLFNNSHK